MAHFLLDVSVLSDTLVSLLGPLRGSLFLFLRGLASESVQLFLPHVDFAVGDVALEFLSRLFGV